MAFRFRKSIKILPGVKLNLSKSGLSTSIGGKGRSVNIGKRGVRSTIGIPGSGISYSSMSSAQNKNPKPVSPVSPSAHPPRTNAKAKGCCLFSIPIGMFNGLINILSFPINYFLTPVNQKYSRPLAVVSIIIFCFACFGLTSLTEDTNVINTPTPTIQTERTPLPTAALPIIKPTIVLTALPTATETPLVIPTSTIFISILPTQPPQSEACSCSGDTLNCSDFGSHSSAQACYNYCTSIGMGDIHGLDKDGNGSACESLP